MLYSNKPVYLAAYTDRRPHNDTDDNKRANPNLTYCLAQLKDYIFDRHVYGIPLTLVCDLGKCNFAMKNDTKIIITLERNMNKLLESNKKVTTIPTDPDALIQTYDRPYISHHEISVTKQADIYFAGILITETALRQGVLESPYQQELRLIQGLRILLAHLRMRKDNLTG